MGVRKLKARAQQKVLEEQAEAIRNEIKADMEEKGVDEISVYDVFLRIIEKVYIEVPEFTGENVPVAVAARVMKKRSAVYQARNYTWISEIWNCLQEGGDPFQKNLTKADETITAGEYFGRNSN